MARYKVLNVAFVALLVFALMAAPYVSATISCEQVTNWLTPCITYGLFGGTVPSACCAGINTLNAASNTTEDRRAQCNCVKEGAAKIPGLNYDRVNELPGKCGTTCPYKLSHDLDCSKAN
ncbi:hypothetical protein CRYUN_Cryun03dG0182400 [Craigia yunnanensis]